MKIKVSNPSDRDVRIGNTTVKGGRDTWVKVNLLTMPSNKGVLASGELSLVFNPKPKSAPKPEPVKVEAPKPEPVKVEAPKPQPEPEPVKVEAPKPQPETEPVKVEAPKPQPQPEPEPEPEPVSYKKRKRLKGNN